MNLPVPLPPPSPSSPSPSPLTNSSGIGFGARTPASLRKRLGELASSLVLLPPGQSYTEFAVEAAEKLDKSVVEPFSTFLRSVFSRELEEVPEDRSAVRDDFHRIFND